MLQYVEEPEDHINKEAAFSSIELAIKHGADHYRLHSYPSATTPIFGSDINLRAFCMPLLFGVSSLYTGITATSISTTLARLGFRNKTRATNPSSDPAG